MPKPQKNQEKIEDWVRFKFSRYLWVRFLQRCIDSGRDIDDTVAQIIAEWCLVTNPQRTEAILQDKDQLKREFTAVLEDLSRRAIHHTRRAKLVNRAREIRKQLQILNETQ